MAENSRSIGTLLFFDLETTGLPFSHNPRITELSLCAIEKNHFIDCKAGTIPRVTNRLNLCVYPSRLVDPKAAEITLLDNYNLQNQGRFTDDVYEIINRFIMRLSGPVCLIAHNGLKFDFPILMAELKKIKKELPEDLLCADSLPVFRELHNSKLQDDCPSDSQFINEFQRLNETTPKKKIKVSVAPESPAQKEPVSPKLFPAKKISFSLPEVYERLYKKKPATSHMAEADVLCLVLSAVAEGKNFVMCIENIAVPFSQTRKMW